MSWLYVVILVACLVCTAPLELVLGARVYRRARRVILTLVPVVVVFGAWDIWAVVHGQWRYDPRQTLGVVVARLPLEEIAFFVVVPICAMLTWEAVAVRRPNWPRPEDEPGDHPARGDR